MMEQTRAWTGLGLKTRCCAPYNVVNFRLTGTGIPATDSAAYATADLMISDGLTFEAVMAKIRIVTTQFQSILVRLLTILISTRGPGLLCKGVQSKTITRTSQIANRKTPMMGSIIYTHD